MIDNEHIQSKASYWVSLESEGHNIHDDKNFIFWLAQRKEHKIAFEKEKIFLSEINLLPQDFLDELKNEVKMERKNINKRKTIIKRYIPLSVAACILSMLYIFMSIDKISFSKEYIASNKILNDITLPDKSKISLDVMTTVHVSYYKDKRLIDLSNGRAVFDVSHDKSRPFEIHTKNVNIQVLGTKFEVVNHNDSFELNVFEGKVRVSDSKDKLLALVTKGNALKLDEYLKIDSLKKVDTTKIAQWKQGKFTFEQVSLKEVIDEFSKYIDISITFENTKLASLPISGNFDAFHFKDFLVVLPLIHPLTIEQENNKIFIKRKI